MSTQEDRYYSSSVEKSRRSSPGGDSQNSLFHSQSGRTILPPLSSAVPNSPLPVPSSYTTAFTQPRSSPGRLDYNMAAFSQWSPNNNTTQPQSFTYYDAHDRYPVHSSYATYSSRTSPSIPDHSAGDSRKLPPLDTSSTYDREQRYHHNVYSVPASHGSPISQIRSPTASYPQEYVSYGSPANYTYGVHHHHPTIQPVNSHNNTADLRSSSSYPRGSGHGPSSYSPPPPISPTTSEEPISAVKKKRKRADAHQLKILTETYNRTAFPSTEERLELAKILDMTPRSVQIWFQNRRQSMRQTRQIASTAHVRDLIRIPPPPVDDLEEPGSSQPDYHPPHRGSSFAPGAHSPPLTSVHRRPTSREVGGEGRRGYNRPNY